MIGAGKYVRPYSAVSKLTDVVIYHETFGSLAVTSTTEQLPEGWSFDVTYGQWGNGNWFMGNDINTGYLPGSNGYDGASGYSHLAFVPQAGASENLNYFQFTKNFTGYKNIRVQLAMGYYMSGLASPPATFRWMFSSNGGDDWESVEMPLTTPYPEDNTWEFREFQFPTSANNKSLLLRLVGTSYDGSFADQIICFDDIKFIADEI